MGLEPQVGWLVIPQSGSPDPPISPLDCHYPRSFHDHVRPNPKQSPYPAGPSGSGWTVAGARDTCAKAWRRQCAGEAFHLCPGVEAGRREQSNGGSALRLSGGGEMRRGPSFSLAEPRPGSRARAREEATWDLGAGRLRVRRCRLGQRGRGERGGGSHRETRELSCWFSITNKSRSFSHRPILWYRGCVVSCKTYELERLAWTQPLTVVCLGSSPLV